jgi:hypothetical protein
MKLRHRDIDPGVDVQPDLDDRAGMFKLGSDGLEWGRPFVMNDRILHKRVSLISPPAPYMPSNHCSEPLAASLPRTRL